MAIKFKVPTQGQTLDRIFFDTTKLDHLMEERLVNLRNEGKIPATMSPPQLPGLDLIRVPVGFILLGNTLQIGGEISKFTLRPYLNLDPGYYVSDKLATWSLWERYAKETGVQTQAIKYEDNTLAKVSYFNLVDYAEWLNKQVGYEFPYDNEKRAKLEARGIQLPEITDWEYFAKGTDEFTHYYPFTGSRTQNDSPNLKNELGITGLNRNMWQWTQTDAVDGFEQKYVTAQLNRYGVYMIPEILERINYHFDLVHTPFEDGEERIKFMVDRATVDKSLFLRIVRSRWPNPVSLERDIKEGKTTLPIGYGIWVAQYWDQIEPLTLADFSSTENEENRRVIMGSLDPKELFTELGKPKSSYKYEATLSLVSVDPITGKYVQQYKTVPAEYHMYEVDATVLGFNEAEDPRIAVVSAACTTTGREYLLTVPTEYLGKDVRDAVAYTFPCPISDPQWVRRQGDVAIWGKGPNSKLLNTPKVLSGKEYFKLLVAES